MTLYPDAAPHRTITIARQADGDYSASLDSLRGLLQPAWTVLDQCAAWTAVAPGDAIYAHGARVLMGDRIVRFGTSVGYALANGDDPVAALDWARHRDHETHWINLECGSLSSGPVVHHDILFRHRVGDRIILEGRAFTIAPARNRNFMLIPDEA